MTKEIKLELEEKQAIKHKVSFELNEMQLKMTKIGASTNIIGGLLVVGVLYGEASLGKLLAWYGVLVLLNVINIIFSFYFQYSKVKPEHIDSWLRIYHWFIVPPVCIAWGMIGVLFLTNDIHYQFYIFALLLAVVISFSLGTISDFIASAISINCLIIPSLFINFYIWLNSFLKNGNADYLNLGLAICLLILGVFLLITCYIGYRLIKNSYELTYINVALSHKLENMNKFLEERVIERTAELQESLNLVTYQATHDLLTELPNHNWLLKYLQRGIESANHNKNSLAVAFFSINEIEKINDGLGHQVGEIVIQTIAKRFQEKFKKSAKPNELRKLNYTVTLSRRDVFVIVIEPIFKEYEIENAVKELFSVLDDAVNTGKEVIKLTASIGVSLYPRDGNEIKSLLMNADAAVLGASQHGGNIINVYKERINADLSKEIEMEHQLYLAVKNNEFVLQYQPFIDLQSGKICGAEALIRWNHPKMGLISPLDFIPLAETNGLIVPIGEWVLFTACEQAKKWQDQGLASIKIAVNLSAKQLQKRDILRMIENVLSKTQLKPEFLELELTETEAFKENVIPILKEFKAMGLALSIDDFGTGYSGLTNIKLFSIDKLKIDKGFVQDINKSDHSKAIISNTISLAKKINVKVLAEGVQTKEQLQFLITNGCDMIQGYYFSPPLSVDMFTKLLESKTEFVI